MDNDRNFFGIVLKFLKNSLLDGLLIMLPFTLTVGIFMISFRMLMAWLRPIESFITHPIKFLTSIEYTTIATQLGLMIGILFLCGLVIRLLLLDTLLHHLEELIFKIPLVKPIYSGIKQLVQALSIQDKDRFKRVVIVEFPRPGVYSLGFLTGEVSPALAPEPTQKFFTIFIPTTPNPTTGFFLMVAENQLKTADLSHQEAMGLIISGGIIQPERFMR